MAEKKINGRKRHLLVDTLGLILEMEIHDADIQDRDGARRVLEGIVDQFPRLAKIVADGGYQGPQLGDWVKEHLGIPLEIVKRTDAGFKILPKRWIVERTFGWLVKNRRLCRDYERNASSVESWIYLAMIRLMTRRLTQKADTQEAIAV